MADTRSREDRIAGILRIGVGGVEKIVPTLPTCEIRGWQAALSARPGRFHPQDDESWTQEDAADFSSLTIDAILDIVVSYDRTGALGGREWLEANADPAQLYEAATQMAEVSFPFAENTPLLLAALVLGSVVGSKPTSSTNSPSPSGASTRGRSKRPSTRSS